MKKAINAWAYPADMPIAERMRLAADAGYDGIELIFTEEGDISLQCSDGALAEYRKIAEDYGLRIQSIIASVFGNAPLSSADPSVTKTALDRGARMLHGAAVLGADTALVVPGRVTPENRYDVVYENAVENVRKLAKSAADAGVYIGIENVWNKFLLSPLEMRAFVDYAQSPWVGVYFDVGNFLPWAYPEQWIEILGSRIKKLHLKDFKINVGTGHGFVDLLEGDVDYKAVMAACRKVCFDDFCVAEVGPFRQEPTLKLYTTALAMDAIFKM
ncbi:MAG: sugar phosphate isomerase/epimerase [Clostridiales bacterium]|nr:sugar phosphate isomerase/epimerase [Clostridiales bacterium]